VEAKWPQNSATPAAKWFRRPMPVSLSQINLRGTAPSWVESSDHIPASRSAVLRVGIILAVMNFENDATITNTGNITTVPSPTGIFGPGNHRSHWT